MLSAFLVLLLAGASGAATPDWPSWGGPNGNFVVNGKGLPRTFADSPPKQVWQRRLGDGYSSIVSDLNEKGLRMRNGKPWTRVAVFNMTPRLIEVGPRLFSTEEWNKTRQRFSAPRE